MNQPVGPTQPVTPARSTPPPARRQNRWLWVGLGALVLAVICCALAAAWLLGSGVGQALTEWGSVQGVVSDYMGAMSRGDVQAAYGLFTESVRADFSPEEAAMLLEEEPYLYEGFRSLRVTKLTIVAVNPQTGQVVPSARANGTVQYNDGTSGEFIAILEKHGDQWQIYNVTVSAPDRFTP